MARTNRGIVWVGNYLFQNKGGPTLYQGGGTFAAGASTAVFSGEFLELSGGVWTPLNTDKDMSAGIFAFAAVKVESGDLAGYRKIILPTLGDVFRATLLSTDSQSPSVGTALYISNTNSDYQTVSTTAGANILGYVVGLDHYPQEQGHQAHDASVDRGTTIRSLQGGEVLFSVTYANSYASVLWPVS